MLENKGWNLGSDKNEIWLYKNGQQIRFDIKITTRKGAIYCMYFKRNQKTEVGATATENKMNIVKAHGLFGHGHEDNNRKTAKALGIDIVRGTLPPCAACTAAKAEQKAITKNVKYKPATTNNERIYTDTATLYKTMKNGKKEKIFNGVWCIKVDERTQLKFSDFYNTKSGIVEPTLEKFNKWEQAGKPVKNVRLDNAGENVKMKKRSESADWKMNINWEFTARNTPQQNHLLELGFTTIAAGARAMMHAANVPLEQRYKLVKEAIKTKTLLDGLTVITIDGKADTRYKHWCGSNPKFTNHLRTWGEAGTVTLRDHKSGKIIDRGVHCMFVGYATDHAGDCYRMWDPTTGRVHLTRDIRWLKRMFFTKKLTRNDTVDDLHIEQLKTDTTDTDDKVITIEEPTEKDDVQAGEGTTTEAEAKEESKEEEFEELIDRDDIELVDELEEDVPPATETRRSTRVTKPPPQIYNADKLGGSDMDPVLTSDELGGLMKDDYQIELTPAEENYYRAMTEIGAVAYDGDNPEIYDLELAAVGAGLGGGFGNTQELHVMKYDQVMETEDKPKWDNAVKEEYVRMQHRHKVFKPVHRKEVPKDKKILTSTWAMKKKSSGAYRARVNARGFEQVPGEHYNKTRISSPTVNDVTIRIILCLMIMATWYAELIDIYGAFLHGDF